MTDSGDKAQATGASGESPEAAETGRTEAPAAEGEVRAAEGDPGATGGVPPEAEEGPSTGGDGSPAGVREAEEREGDEAPDELLDELEELRDRHLRLAAEFENYRKRTRKELLKTRETGAAELARRLLDALDDLGRIVETPTESTTVEALHEGIELVERKLLKELGEAGLERIRARGEPFDPNLHEALTTVPTDRPEEDDTVGREFVPGYTFGERLLRPARVEVKKYAEGGGDGSAKESGA